MYTAPTIAQFKTQFVRDFPYGTDPRDNVLDADIANAFNLTDININQALFQNQTSYQMFYCYLAAHYLVLNLRNSSQGMNGQYNWAQNSKGVGPVNESFSIPDRVLKNPYFMSLTKTNYGAFYLNQLWPQLCGQMFTVYGRTNP